MTVTRHGRRAAVPLRADSSGALALAYPRGVSENFRQRRSAFIAVTH